MSPQNLEIHLHDGSVLKGEVALVAGRLAKINLVNGEEISADDIKHIITAGKEESSMAEDTRYQLLIKAIKEPKQLFQSPFLRLIWYNPDPNTLPWPQPLHCRPKATLEVDFIHRSLNDSQEDAANAALLLDNENRITVLIGPPGSGLNFTHSSVSYSNYSFYRQNHCHCCNCGYPYSRD